MFRNLRSWAWKALLWLPLFRRLEEVPPNERRAAFFETLTTTVFATMPFWVLPLLGWFIFDPKPSFGEALKQGEGLIYAAALLGPLVYVITKRYGRFNLRFGDSSASSPLSMSFPYGGAFVTITALTCAVAGFAFAASRGGSSQEIDPAGVSLLSAILMIVATAIFFLVTAYSNMLDDLEKNKAERVIEEQPRQEQVFVDDWLGSKR